MPTSTFASGWSLRLRGADELKPRVSAGTTLRTPRASAPALRCMLTISLGRPPDAPSGSLVVWVSTGLRSAGPSKPGGQFSYQDFERQV